MRFRALFACCLALALATAASAAQDHPKVDPWVIEKSSRGPTEFLVMLREQADLRGARALPTKTQKSAFVADALSATAARVQAPLRALLDARGAEYRSYWVANMIWVRGDRNLVEELAAREDVFARLRQPVGRPARTGLVEAGRPACRMRPTRSSGASRRCTRPRSGRSASTGQGIVVAGEDTGYQWDHPALKAKYRGWDGTPPTTTTTGTTPSIRAAARAAPTRLRVPCDDNGHGTHTMGTMVGDDGGEQPDRRGARREVDRLPQHGPGRRHARHLHRVLPVVHRADGPAQPEPRPDQVAPRDQQLLGLPAERRLHGPQRAADGRREHARGRHRGRGLGRQRRVGVQHDREHAGGDLRRVLLGGRHRHQRHHRRLQQPRPGDGRRQQPPQAGRLRAGRERALERSAAAATAP